MSISRAKELTYGNNIVKTFVCVCMYNMCVCVCVYIYIYREREKERERERERERVEIINFAFSLGNFYSFDAMFSSLVCTST